MKTRTLLGIMFFAVPIISFWIAVGVGVAISSDAGEAKRNRDADRIRVLFDSEEAYDAIVDNYKTGKTIGEVLDEILKEKP